jgi:reversibly glycosylated polypeptide / UDP-arabinopyranose mutase
MGTSIQETVVVVPTIRPEKIQNFIKVWGVEPIVVYDGKKPKATYQGKTYSVKDIMGKYSDLIFNFNDGVRNLGFALAYKLGAEVIVSLDDDTLPLGDTIGDHLEALNKHFPITWMNTANEVYMRGFPYKKRQEAECVFSHGVWQGVADFDASTQLVLGTDQPTYPKMPVPKGILFPVCVMNVAFKRKVLPYYYQAPMVDGINRFADIWSGVEMKKAIDKKGWCAVTGFAKVRHERASDPYVNLIKEAKGIQMNESYGQGEYFRFYQDKIKRWQDFLCK